MKQTPTLYPAYIGEHILDPAILAKALSVKPATVVGWIKTGRLKGFQLGGHRTQWRITLSEVMRFLGMQQDLSDDQRAEISRSILHALEGNL